MILTALLAVIGCIVRLEFNLRDQQIVHDKLIIEHNEGIWSFRMDNHRVNLDLNRVKNINKFLVQTMKSENNPTSDSDIIKSESKGVI